MSADADQTKNIENQRKLLHPKKANSYPLSERKRQLNTLFDLFVERSELLKRFPVTITQEIFNYIDIHLDTPFSVELIKKARKRKREGIWLTEKSRVNPPSAGHGSLVTAMTVSPDGEHFLSGAADGSVGYWHYNQDKPLWLMHAHKSWVSDVAISPDKHKALSAGDEGSLFLWNVDLGTRRPVAMPSSVSVWPQIPFCSFIDDETIFVVRGGKYVKIDLLTESEMWQTSDLGVHDRLHECGEGTNFDFSPVSKRLAEIGANKSEVRVCDGKEGKVLFNFKFDDDVFHISLSSDGSKMVVADAQGRLTGFDLVDGRRLDVAFIKPLYVLCHAFKESMFFGYDIQGNILKIYIEQRFRIENLGEVKDLRFPPPTIICTLPDSRNLIAGLESGAIVLFNAEGGGYIRQVWKKGRSLSGGDILPEGQGAVCIQGVRKAGDSGQGNALLFIHPSGGKEHKIDMPHEHFISGVAVLGQKTILSVDKGGTAVIWKKGKVSKVYRFSDTDCTACAGCLESGLGVVATQDARVILLKRKRKEISLPSLSVSNSVDKFIAGICAVASAGKPVQIFAAYFNGLVSFVGKGVQWVGPDDLRHHLSGTAVALDSRCTLAADGNRNGEVRIWRCSDGSKVAELSLHGGEVTALTFSPDVSMLYTAGTDRFIYAINLADKEVIFATVLPLPPISLRAEGGNRLFALDSAGSIYGFSPTL